MATVNYLFPFTHEPTVEEMASHDLIRFEVEFDGSELVPVVHNLALPPSVDPHINIVPRDLIMASVEGFDANTIAVLASSAGLVRFELSRPN